MESLEPSDNLYNDFPYMLLFYELLIGLTFANALENVSVVGKLHHDAIKKH